MFQVFYMDVAYDCYGSIRMFRACFRCFKLMLQVFHLNVAKVDLDVAYVVVVIHACFKRIFQVFCLFQTYVASFSSKYFKSRSRRGHVSMMPVAGAQLPAGVGGAVESHYVGTCGQQTPLRRASASSVGDGTHVGPGNGRGCGMGCWGVGWAVGAQDGRSGMMRCRDMGTRALDGMQTWMGGCSAR